MCNYITNDNTYTIIYVPCIFIAENTEIHMHIVDLQYKIKTKWNKETDAILLITKCNKCFL